MRVRGVIGVRERGRRDERREQDQQGGATEQDPRRLDRHVGADPAPKLTGFRTGAGPIFLPTSSSIAGVTVSAMKTVVPTATAMAGPVVRKTLRWAKFRTIEEIATVPAEARSAGPILSSDWTTAG